MYNSLPKNQKHDLFLYRFTWTTNKMLILWLMIKEPFPKLKMFGILTIKLSLTVLLLSNDFNFNFSIFLLKFDLNEIKSK